MRHVLLGLLLAILLTTPAQAFTVSGGTAEQQAWAREVMQASNLDLEGCLLYTSPSPRD